MSRTLSEKQLLERIARHKQKAEKAAAQLDKIKAAKQAREAAALSAAFLACYKRADSNLREQIKTCLEGASLKRNQYALTLAALGRLDDKTPQQEGKNSTTDQQ